MTHATLLATIIARCLLLAGLLCVVPASAQALTPIVATQFVTMLLWETPLPPDASSLEPCVYVSRVTEEVPRPELDAHPRCARLDDQGQPRLEASHLDLIAFDDEGLATAHIAGDWYYLTREGEALRVLSFDNGPDPFSEGLVRGLRGDKIGYFDTSFGEVVPARYDWGWPFEDGLALVCLGCEPEPHGEHWMMVGGKYGYVDSKGRELVPVALTRQEAVALREHTLVLEYEDFGPQSAAHELLGMQWWQWEAHGDTGPRHYEIRVVVYRGLPLAEVQRSYPVIPEREQDVRYVEYGKAIRYLDRQIEEDAHPPTTVDLKMTRERVVRALGLCLSPLTGLSPAYPRLLPVPTLGSEPARDRGAIERGSA